MFKKYNLFLDNSVSVHTYLYYDNKTMASRTLPKPNTIAKNNKMYVTKYD